MKDIKSSNIPQMSINKVIDSLSSAYTKVINNKMPIKSFPSVMLWGAPGVGKSQAVRQIAKVIEDKTTREQGGHE